MVLVVPPAIASGPLNRGTRVLDSRGLSTGIFRGHVLLKVPSRIHYIKYATTSDHDDRRTGDLSVDFLRHVVLWCVQEFCRSSLLARYTERFEFSITGISPRAFCWGHLI